MVTAREAYRTVKDLLHKAGIEDAGFEADILVTHVAGCSRLLADDLGDDAYACLQAMAQRRALREPLQYIVGRWPFMELQLWVGPGVLIPRPETEEVCLAAAELLAAQQVEAPVIVDLCSGTGALALGLYHLFPQASVTAVELYPEALGYLQRNIAECFSERVCDGEKDVTCTETAIASAETDPLQKRPACGGVQAVCADVLQYHAQLLPQSVNLIVSNPPYVTPEEYTTLEVEVYAEPRQALVPPQGEDGLLFYRHIAQHYRFALKEGGALVFEIGADQGEAVRRILEENGYCSVEIRRDIAGKERIALARR